MPIKADKSLLAYYNEIDPYAAQWLRNLMAEGWITKGDVDERSIEDVRPNELAGYDRLHFFAGVAVWDYALNQAGWGRREVWTGSCPCQPFSAAGKGAGFADERHLWPHFHWLITQCRPAVVLGEQVASKDGLAWLDLVQADLEGAGYTSGAVDTCAAGFGAPHIRQRLYWVAYADGPRPQGRRGMSERADQCAFGQGGMVGGLSDAEGPRPPHRGAGAIQPIAPQTGRTSPTNGHWADADWLLCRDGKWRPVESSTFPLVDRAPARVVRSSNPGAPIDAYSGEARVMRLRGYGNAINSEAAINFVRACKESIHGIF